MATPQDKKLTTGPSDTGVQQAVRQGTYFAPSTGPVNPTVSQETNKINQERMKAQEILDKNKGIKGSLTGTKPSIVLARKDGVEGKLDKTTGAFNSGNWDKEQSSRFVRQGMANWKSQTGKEKERTGSEVWKTSNPSLAAAAAEKARIRGTAQSDNPLMKGFRPRMAGPTVQAPAVQKLGAGNQSLTQNPAAGRSPVAAPAARPNTTAVAFSPSIGNLAARSTGQVSGTASAAPRPATPVRPITPVVRPVVRRPLSAADQRGGGNLNLRAGMEYDAYDLVLEYLFDYGHADTIIEAEYLMTELDESFIQTLIETYEANILAEEVESWVNELLEEGYDLSEYTWDDMVDYYFSEARVDDDSTPLQKIRKRNKEYFSNDPEAEQKTTQRRSEHKSQRGVKPEKGAKSAFGTMRNVGGPYR